MGHEFLVKTPFQSPNIAFVIILRYKQNALGVPWIEILKKYLLSLGESSKYNLARFISM